LSRRRPTWCVCSERVSVHADRLRALESAQADLARLQPRIPSPGKEFLHTLRTIKRRPRQHVSACCTWRAASWPPGRRPRPSPSPTTLCSITPCCSSSPTAAKMRPLRLCASMV